MSVEIGKSLQLKEIEPSESMVESHFFNSSKFLRTKPFVSKGWQLIREKPIAQIFFSIQEDTSISGHQATFGSFDILSGVSEMEFKWFIQEVLIKLKGMNSKEVLIRNYPAYFKNSELVKHVLHSLGFSSKWVEVNQHIPVTVNSFEEVAKRNEKKKMRQCERAGYRFHLASLADLPAIYKLVEDTRLRKGFPVSMTFNELENAISNNPDSYKLFTLCDNNELIAASVSIVINSDVIYNFYHADSSHYRSKSPLTYLVSEIYRYCQLHEFTALDLGISSDHGKLNDGLFAFKQNLGAIASDKVTYNLKLN